MPTPASISPPKTIRAKAWLFLKLLGQRVWGGQTLDESAALAYHTLFSLLPVFILIVLILSMFSSHRPGDTGTLESQVRDFFYSQLKLDTLSDSDQSLNLREIIDTQIEHARAIIRHPLTGIIGFAVLLYAASKIMLVIEKSFNRIYGSPAPRTWTRRITLYWSVLTLGPILGAASLVVTKTVFTLAAANDYTRPLLVPLTFFAGFCISWLLMLLLYKIIPGTNVQWTAALIGSFAAAVLWEVAKATFGLYVRATISGNNWYGALVIVPLFMFWVYLMWSFTLLGLQIAYLWQFFPVLARRHAYQEGTSSLITDMQWILPLAVVLVRSFRAGKPLSAYAAAEELNLPSEITSEFLGGMERASLVHRVRSNSFVLARPPETITALELIASARALCSLPVETGPDALAPAARAPALAQLSAEQAALYKTRTLADLAGEARA